MGFRNCFETVKVVTETTILAEKCFGPTMTSCHLNGGTSPYGELRKHHATGVTTRTWLLFLHRHGHGDRLQGIVGGVAGGGDDLIDHINAAKDLSEDGIAPV